MDLEKFSPKPNLINEFVLFIQRFFSRLYLFPLKHIYVASVYVSEVKLHVPFLLPLVMMLWILLIMNVYWFSVSLT
jgi:hypothetical protein